MDESTQKSIVVVDDTPENLRLLAKLLTEHGYRVRVAPNGERALATIQKEPPDLILLDIVMPNMDGYEVCRRLKADKRTSNIPVIFVSASNEAFDRVTAFSIGAVDYITKPFQIEEILTRVQTHLSLEEMRTLLRTQNQQFQEQNGELEAFAHTVAHDLKNPLSTTLGYLDLLRDPSSGLNEDALSLVTHGINGVYKMYNIIDELLLLASVRREDVEFAPIDMGSIVQHAFSRLPNMIQRYEPEVFIPKEWPVVEGYAPWLEEVWVNYISNALKYGGQPPRLELEATPYFDGWVRFSVRDNGQGVDEAAQSRLFTEFTRLDKIRAEGNGLGLSIVRRIMDKLGGRYGLESTPGQGSLFYFALPCTPTISQQN
jgi:signal transduction histidine kinase